MKTVEERFWSRVEVQPNGCWHWTGKLHTGYGRIWVVDTVVAVHRFAYELLVGPIPAGLQVDHTCHNRDLACPGGRVCAHRRCVNPDHLEPVTPGDNIRRSPLRGSPWRRRQTHCHNGHEFTEQNTNVRGGHRVCRTCCRERARGYRLLASTKETT